MSKTLLIALFVFVAASQTFGHDAKPMVEQNLAKIIMKSGRSLEEHPQRNVQCFSIYLPKINEATNVYEFEYNKCVQTADNATAAIEAEVVADRANIKYGADRICKDFTACSAKNLSFDFFECYNGAAGEAITISYDIQTVSKNKMQYITQKYQSIAYERQTCFDICSDAYVQETSSLYAELDVCLNGGQHNPTPTATPTKTTTGLPTTPNTSTVK